MPRRTSGRRGQRPRDPAPIAIAIPTPAPLPAGGGSAGGGSAGDSGDDDQLLTTDQAAAFLGVTSKWLQGRRAKDRKAGKPGLHGPQWTGLGPRFVRYKRRWLKEYPDANPVPSR